MSTPTDKLRGLVLGVLGILALFIVPILGFKMFENVDAGEIVIIQDPFDGELHIHRTPGIVGQRWGKVTRYEKSYQYDFQDVKTRFNDKGKAEFKGTIRWDMPTSDQKLILLHEKFGDTGGEEAIERELLRPTMDRAIYMSGPLMSSTESAAAKRTDLISYVTDQARYGVYQTATEEIKVADAVTGKETTKNVVRLQSDSNSPGGYVREEPSDIQVYGINISNFTIQSIDYADAIDRQIEDQRRLEMDIQTAIAETKKAEQAAIKAEKQGQANAAEAKWKQEVQKAKAITQAEQRKEVAALELETARLERQQKEEQARGEVALRKAKMQGDGALKQKLDAYIRVQETWAKAFSESKNPLVPHIQMGGGQGGDATTNVQQLLQMLNAKTARDLALDVNPGGS